MAPPGIAIGVDIESAGRVRNQTLRLVTTPAERALVERGALDATALWTCKEAVLKAAGAGLSDVRRVSISGDSGHLDGVHYHLTRQALDGGLLLAIATSHAQPPPRGHWPDAARLFALPSPRGRRRVA